MGTDKYRLLVSGIAAVKDGRTSEARQLLYQVIQEDSRNEAAWLWLSGAVENDKDRIICLENVLEINPDNEAAQRGLKILQERASQQTQQRPHRKKSDAEVEAEPDGEVQQGASNVPWLVGLLLLGWASRIVQEWLGFGLSR